MDKNLISLMANVFKRLNNMLVVTEVQQEWRISIWWLVRKYFVPAHCYEPCLKEIQQIDYFEEIRKFWSTFLIGGL